jgi:hypothetical protein
MPLGENTNGGARPLTGSAGGGSANQIALGLKDLHPEQVRAIVVPMYATLGAAILTGYDNYRVPTTHDFLIEQIKAHVVLMDLASEAAAADADVPMPSFADRVAMKAANALIDLKNSDREQKVIENHSMSIAGLMQIAGGSPIDFGLTPQKVLAGESLRLDVRFANSALANQIAGNTQYGVLLIGKLIRVAKS